MTCKNCLKSDIKIGFYGTFAFKPRIIFIFDVTDVTVHPEDWNCSFKYYDYSDEKVYNSNTYSDEHAASLHASLIKLLVPIDVGQSELKSMKKDFEWSLKRIIEKRNEVKSILKACSNI